MGKYQRDEQFWSPFFCLCKTKSLQPDKSAKYGCMNNEKYP